MLDRVHFERGSKILAACVLCSMIGACERDATSAPPDNASPPPSADLTENDVAALREVFPESRTASDVSLPPGHPPIDGTAGMAPRAPAAARGTPVELQFTAPAEWQVQEPRSSLRKAQYLLPRVSGDSEDGELVVFYFGPGEGGNVRDNIDRWRGQFTTPEGGPLPVEASREESFDANGHRVTLLDVVGRFAPSDMPGMAPQPPRNNFRMFAAVIETSGGPWFIKATGPAATMAGHWEAVKGFITSATP